MSKKKRRIRDISEIKPVGYVRLEPTWAGLMPAMLAVLQDPRAPQKAKGDIRDELMRLARAMDEINKERAR